MGSRPTRGGGQRAKKFGALLEDLRKRAVTLRKRTSYEQVAVQLEEQGVASISGSTLQRYEKEGRVPDVLAVKALAELYGEDASWLVACLLADLEHRPMPAKPIKGAPVDVELESAGEGDEPPPFSSVRIVEGRIAAGPPLVVNELETAGHFAFEKRWLARHGIARPVCVRVGSNEQSMMPTINPGELVLLDCSDERRASPRHDRIYAVNVDGGSTLKRLAITNGAILLVADNPNKEKYPTRPLTIDEHTDPLTAIVGEVMWRGELL